MATPHDRDSGLARVASLTRWVAGAAAGGAALLAVVLSHPHLPTINVRPAGLTQTTPQPSPGADLQAPAQAPVATPAPAQATSGGS
jgi:hypothetical protein